MYFVHIYSLHVYRDLVDLDSSGPSGVRPTPGLTSSTKVVCVCVRASTHPLSTLTPAKIENYIYKTKPLSLIEVLPVYMPLMRPRPLSQRLSLLVSNEI